MSGQTNRQRDMTAWTVSLMLHAGFLLIGLDLLIQPAHFHVAAGKTSAEIALAIEAAPVAVTEPPAPLLPPVPVPAIVPTPPPVRFLPPMPSGVAVIPDFAKPSNPPRAAARPKPDARPATRAKVLAARQTSNAPRGALQAEPDDLHNPPPDYPEESRIAHEQGVVRLRVEVTAAGDPARVSIVQSSGFFRLDQAARDAVRHWKFHPALAAGFAVPCSAEVPVRFSLNTIPFPSRP